MRVAVGYFDEIAEYFVITDLERAYAGSRSFLGLNSGDAILSTVTEGAPFIQCAVDPFAHTRLIANRDRRTVHQCPDDLVTDVGAAFPRTLVLGKCRCFAAGGAERALECCLDRGQMRDRIAKRAQLSRRSAARRSFSREPFDVPHAIECIAKRKADIPPPEMRLARAAVSAKAVILAQRTVTVKQIQCINRLRLVHDATNRIRLTRMHGDRRAWHEQRRVPEQFADGRPVRRHNRRPTRRRLEARPWTRYSVAYKEQLERDKKGRAAR